jgi:tetratricopeptide (TPR) repeat protein
LTNSRKTNSLPAALALLICLSTVSLRANDFVGPEQCGKCHPGEFVKQSGSNHAKALSPIARSPIAAKLAGHTVREKNGLRFEYSQAPNGIEVTVERGGQRSAALLEWAFGSGVRGITPVGSIDGHYFEHRISWYTAGDRASLTMGHKAEPPGDIVSALGQKQSAETIFQCFNCHATGSKAGPDVSELRPGIQCERCHGPGEAHVRAPSAKSIYNPGRLSPAAVVEACGQCHRLAPPEIDDRESIRFAPVGLTASRCFRQSGKLSCLTCHDPHSDVNRDAAYYVNKCVECHSGSTPAVNCRRAARDNCLTCHMAKSNTAPFLTFTDHRIRVSHLLASQAYQALGDPAKAVAEAQSEISSNPASLAGYLQLGQIFLEYNTPEPAVEIFSKALRIAPDSLLAHLGEGLALKGIQRFDLAEKELSLCLMLNPQMAVAFDGLAGLYIEAVEYEKLAGVSRQYLRTNPSDYRGYYYLATAQEHAGEDRQATEALLRKAIVLNPGFAASYALLGKLLLQADRAAEAAAELEHAIQLRPDYRPAHLYLANAYRKLGKDGEAAQEAQKLRDLNEKESAKPSLRYHRDAPVN